MRLMTVHITTGRQMPVRQKTVLLMTVCLMAVHIITVRLMSVHIMTGRQMPVRLITLSDVQT
jgi:hypothetical protein